MKYKHWCEDKVWHPLVEDEDTDDKEDDSDDKSGKNNILKENYVATTVCFAVGVTKARLSIWSNLWQIYSYQNSHQTI